MTGRSRFGNGVIAAFLLCGAPAFCATAPLLSGSIAGFVRDAAGVPQMGATVLLFNRYDHQIQQALTNERGVFGFDLLLPDTYSIRVSLASFVPALKQKILVQPGMQSLLYINMASLLSSVELVYAVPGQGALMSDDWKWTLKASSATRPILRALPEYSASDPNQKQSIAGNAVFSETRGILKGSAGDPGSLGGSAQSDLGTAFALATSVFGRNQLQVSGNVGYSARTSIPAAALRTTFSRDGVGPEVTVTMRQVYLPTRSGFGQSDTLPALRTMSVATTDKLQITDRLRLDYGGSLDSVSFLDHLNYFSPFGRLTYDMGKLGSVQFAFSSGGGPTELLNERDGPAGELHNYDQTLAHDLAALTMVPRISVRDGRSHVQRTQDFELGYEKKFGSTTVNLTGFREIVSNGALTMWGAQDLFSADDDILPDISSRSSILNIGSYQRYGYAASVSQRIGERFEIGSSFGSAGALTADQAGLVSASTDELRAKIHTSERFWVSARASATLPVTGTQITGSYQWMDSNAILPNHYYVTQRNYPEAGLNIQIRQPIPCFSGLPGRFEATADLRNLLAEGYLPVSTPDNRRLLLVQSPRAVRGGLSFIF